jgi:hypothetical protein
MSFLPRCCPAVERLSALLQVPLARFCSLAERAVNLSESQINIRHTDPPMFVVRYP